MNKSAELQVKDKLGTPARQSDTPRLAKEPAMTEVEPVLDFASSGRSGRRNALPDILGSPAGVSPSDLPLKLAELSLTDGSEGAQSPTSEEAPPPSESSEVKDGS